jgi:hypothetical protein
VRGARVLLVALAVVLLVPARALAQTGATVTLDASERRVEFGKKVTLSGTSTGAPAGSLVRILDQASGEVATATTHGSGAFSVTIEPPGTNTYVAVLADATSDPVTVQVRSVLSVRMGQVRLFDRVVVRGQVAPARDGEKVDVVLLRSGNRVRTKPVAMAANGSFSTRFRIEAPGTYRAKVSSRRWTCSGLRRARTRTRRPFRTCRRVRRGRSSGCSRGASSTCTTG